MLLLFRSQLLLRINHGFHSVIHVLNKSNFRTAKTTLVRNVINMVVGFSVFSVSTADLHVILVGNGLELRLLLAEIGKEDVNGSAEGCSQIGGARSDITKVFIVCEFGNSLNVRGCS